MSEKRAWEQGLTPTEDDWLSGRPKRGPVRQLARLMPYIEKVAALVIIAAGAYIIHFWLSKEI